MKLLNVTPPKTCWLKSILPSAGTAAKAAGVIGLGTLLYDAHNWGKLKSSEYRQIQDANAGLDYFRNTQYNTNQSHAMSRIKNSMFRWNLGNRIRGDFNSIVGYVKGGVESLVDGIVPLTASIVALKTKGLTSKIAGGVLAGWAVLSFARHGCSHLNDRKGV